MNNHFMFESFVVLFFSKKNKRKRVQTLFSFVKNQHLFQPKLQQDYIWWDKGQGTRDKAERRKNTRKRGKLSFFSSRAGTS